MASDPKDIPSPTVNRGHSRASQCSLWSGLPPFLLQELLPFPSLLLLHPAAPAPASASLLELRLIISLFLQEISSRGCSRRANAVLGMASNQRTLRLPPWPMAYLSRPGRNMTLVARAHLLRCPTPATSTTSRSVSHPTRTVAVLPDELCGLHVMNP